MTIRVLLLLLLLPVLAIAQNRKKKDYLVTVNTPYGPMRLVLYDQTPKHKENFIKLVDKKFYDSLLFHRVIPGFMVQGGDPNSRKAPAGEPLGNGDIGYRIPAEILPELFHKKGVLAAARDNNPEKASSGCQFYVVQGRVWPDDELQKQVERSQTRTAGRVFTNEQKQVYKTLGGSPHLDGSYTVFGEVIDGLAIVDSIAKQPRDPQDRPKQDVRMTVTGEWVKKKKITKQYKFRYLPNQRA
ncbi:peptidylprolyl isomerase [Spirosoma utsteinense]|uniref:Peptidyl-prolyl cis-trans isomerase n=1 Tax=Spirosoma utsteinense TaxID=2585773 RepID=A0ABR6WAJ0_9BACT|nr:peptidylprolyl isomerase [Spirosoma utsteinense]MBC3783837.1 peptidyl-prolyl cis-trans isomerase B (cyclophilin B) [Spirosoma utsteinense]MBC3793584.1 peptidyl-prolyl cis-trans isomerase B (cyclophilin B) [Spirosoma utsteinense]